MVAAGSYWVYLGGDYEGLDEPTSNVERTPLENARLVLAGVAEELGNSSSIAVACDQGAKAFKAHVDFSVRNGQDFERDLISRRFSVDGSPFGADVTVGERRVFSRAVGSGRTFVFLSSTAPGSIRSTDIYLVNSLGC